MIVGKGSLAFYPSPVLQPRPSLLTPHTSHLSFPESASNCHLAQTTWTTAREVWGITAPHRRAQSRPSACACYIIVISRCIIICIADGSARVGASRRVYSSPGAHTAGEFKNRNGVSTYRVARLVDGSTSESAACVVCSPIVISTEAGPRALTSAPTLRLPARPFRFMNSLMSGKKDEFAENTDW